MESLIVVVPLNTFPPLHVSGKLPYLVILVVLLNVVPFKHILCPVKLKSPFNVLFGPITSFVVAEGKLTDKLPEFSLLGELTHVHIARQSA